MATRTRSTSQPTVVSPSKSPADTFVDRMCKVYIAQMQRTDSRPQKVEPI